MIAAAFWHIFPFRCFSCCRETTRVTFLSTLFSQSQRLKGKNRQMLTSSHLKNLHFFQCTQQPKKIHRWITKLNFSEFNCRLCFFLFGKCLAMKFMAYLKKKKCSSCFLVWVHLPFIHCKMWCETIKVNLLLQMLSDSSCSRSQYTKFSLLYASLCRVSCGTKLEIKYAFVEICASFWGSEIMTVSCSLNKMSNLLICLSPPLCIWCF